MTESGVPKRSASSAGIAPLDLQPAVGDREALVDAGPRRPPGDSTRSPTRLFRCSYSAAGQMGSYKVNDDKRYHHERHQDSCRKAPAAHGDRRRWARGIGRRWCRSRGSPRLPGDTRGAEPGDRGRRRGSARCERNGPLTAAIKKAMVDQIEAQVTAGTLTKAQATQIEARITRPTRRSSRSGATRAGRAATDTVAGGGGPIRSTRLRPTSASRRATCGRSSPPVRRWRRSPIANGKTTKASRRRSPLRRSRISTPR